MSTISAMFDASNNTASQRRATELARNDYRFLADLVRQRRQAGLTQEEVASRLGISQPAVAKFERYDADPKLSTIRRYAHAIGAIIGHSVTPDHGQLVDGISWRTVNIAVPGDLEPNSAPANYKAPATKRVDFALAA